MEEMEESVVGESIAKLEEVAQLVTAPKLSFFEIDNLLHYAIIEYLDMRVQMIDIIGKIKVHNFSFIKCVNMLILAQTKP